MYATRSGELFSKHCLEQQVVLIRGQVYFAVDSLGILTYLSSCIAGIDVKLVLS